MPWVASSTLSVCSRLRVCLSVFGTFLLFFSTDAFFVANCSQCITLDPLTSRVNATCVDNSPVGDDGFENTTSGSTCSCIRPYFADPMSGFDPTATNSNSSGSPCKHAFHYSPALFVVEYSPAPLFLLVLVYACRVAHEKIAVVAQKRASAMGVESGLRSKIVCICYPLIAATFLLIAGILTRVAYVSIDPMSVYRIMPSAVNDVLLRIGFQLVLLALLLVMDRCVSRRRDIIFHLWTVNCGPLLTRCFLFFCFHCFHLRLRLPPFHSQLEVGFLSWSCCRSRTRHL